MKHRFAKVLSAVLALVMCMAMGTTAFAANSTGTEGTPATATIVKELQIPGGTTTPEATFKFTATSETTDAPTIAEKSVTYSAADTAADGKLYKTVDLFEGVTFPHAGLYEYTVKETAGTYVAGDKEVMTYSGAEYKLTVVVKNGDNGPYVAEIAAQQIKDNAGTDIAAETKVDPNPTDSSNPTSGGVRFVNTFVKGGSIVKPDPENPDGPDKTDPADALMTIAKNVTGDIGDMVTPFEFTVSASNPAIAPEADQTVKARIYNADGTYGDDISIGANTKVELAHGQKLVFLNLYAGATVSFKETDEIAIEKYSVSATTKNGDAAEQSYEKETVTNTGISVTPVSEKKASATVTNHLESTSPTGVIINNLPFIMMIVVAAAGFVAYIAAKRRRSASAR